MAHSVLPYTAIAIFNQRLKGQGGEPKWIAWGTGAGVHTRTRTALFTEASEARVEGTTSVLTITRTDDTYQISGVMTADGSKSITNAGVFDADEDGNPFVLSDFSAYPVENGNQIAFVWKIQGL